MDEYVDYGRPCPSCGSTNTYTIFKNGQPYMHYCGDCSNEW